jgi:hypothetical protein
MIVVDQVPHRAAILYRGGAIAAGLRPGAPLDGLGQQVLVLQESPEILMDVLALLDHHPMVIVRDTK